MFNVTGLVDPAGTDGRFVATNVGSLEFVTDKSNFKVKGRRITERYSRQVHHREQKKYAKGSKIMKFKKNELLKLIKSLTLDFF